MLPVVLSAVIREQASSTASLLPMPVAASRSMVEAVMSVTVSTAASLMAPAELKVTMSSAAVRVPTRMSPLVSVLAVMSPLPPAVTCVRVNVPPVLVIVIVPSVV